MALIYRSFQSDDFFTCACVHTELVAALALASVCTGFCYSDELWRERAGLICDVTRGRARGGK